MKLQSKVLIVSLIVQFTLLGISHAQELKKIRIGYPSLSFRQSNVWVAKEQGLFKKYGLEVEPIFLRGGQLATLALAAGGPATHYATIILMKHLNFEPKDLTLLPTGPDAERIAAMAAGKIDATLFTSSAAAPARKAGFVELLQIAGLGVGVP